MSVVCCQVDGLVIPTNCGVPECDREASIVRKPWPTGGCCAMGGGCWEEG